MIRALPFLLMLAACSDFPEVGKAEAMLADPGATPALLTAAEIAAINTAAPNRSNALGGEVAGLQDRARRLRLR